MENSLSSKIEKEVKKIELEFMVLNADVRNEMKTKETSLKKNIEQTKEIILTLDEHSSKQSQLESDQIELQKSVSNQGSEIDQVSARLTAHKDSTLHKMMTLNLTSNDLQSRQATIDRELTKLTDKFDEEIIQINGIKLKLIEEGENILRLTDKLSHFETSVKNHIHGTVETRVKELEEAQRQNQRISKKVYIYDFRTLLNH